MFIYVLCIDASLTLRRNEKAYGTYRDNDMIETKRKVKNANSGQLSRPDWVSLPRVYAAQDRTTSAKTVVF